MFGLFKSVVDLVENTAKVVVAPVEIVTDLANAAVKPIAEGIEEVVKDVKDLSKD